MATNVYQMVTDRIIEEMQKGIIPWRKPWHLLGNANECAISYTTRRPYSLLNQFLLGEAGEYLTFNQIKAHGGKIRKGEKSRMVVFYQQIVKEDETKTDENGDPKLVRIPVLRYYNVWNINQVDGIESKCKPVEQGAESKLSPDERAEEIVAGYMAQPSHPRLFIQRSDSAYYAPAGDYVVVPLMEQYNDVAEYYSTMFHELGHSTGHSSRLDRKNGMKVAAFGSADYSREELVAEMTAAMLVNEAGLDAEKAFRNSVAYLQNWLSALKNDNKMIVWAASRAEAAAKWILGIKEEKKDNE